jgi:hypothetical protein
MWTSSPLASTIASTGVVRSSESTDFPASTGESSPGIVRGFLHPSWRNHSSRGCRSWEKVESRPMRVRIVTACFIAQEHRRRLLQHRRPAPPKLVSVAVHSVPLQQQPSRNSDRSGRSPHLRRVLRRLCCSLFAN